MPIYHKSNSYKTRKVYFTGICLFHTQYRRQPVRAGNLSTIRRQSKAKGTYCHQSFMHSTESIVILPILMPIVVNVMGIIYPSLMWILSHQQKHFLGLVATTYTLYIHLSNYHHIINSTNSLPHM